MRSHGLARSAPGFPLSWVLIAFLSAPGPVAARQARPTCQSCHGELEFLRQHVSTLEEAEALYAPMERLAGSAHADMTCVDCHEGFRTFPHANAAETRPCASCHAAVSARWGEGLHALDGGATCRDCHGTHDVRPKSVLQSKGGAHAVREACAACHFEPAATTPDPHADSVSCAACHEPHGTLPAEDELSTVNPLNQGTTCGACHEGPAQAWSDDVHGHAVAPLALPGGPVPEGASRAEPPGCSACHGAHAMLTPSDSAFATAMADRCAHCHESYRESWADSYHGQAAVLGSSGVATCERCHGSHGIYPSTDERSAVGEAGLLSTCQTCHPDATAGFTKFQPHADHNDKERYPYVYWSYHLMTTLLIGVFLVFGAHTALWLARLGIDALRGTPHGAHHDAGA